MTTTSSDVPKMDPPNREQSVPRDRAAPGRNSVPIASLFAFFVLLLPYYARPFLSDVLDGETASILFRSLGSFVHPSYQNWFGGSFIRPLAFNGLGLLSYGLFGLDAFGWHLLVVIGYFAISYQLVRLYFRLSFSVMAAFLGAAWWSLNYSNNHVLLVTNGGNFIHLLAFVLSLHALLDFCETGRGGRLGVSVLWYLVALFSNDIAPLMIAVYVVFLFAFKDQERPLGSRIGMAMRSGSAYLFATVPYWLVLLTHLGMVGGRDDAHKMHFILANFLQNLRLFGHWLLQIPSLSWQDAFYRLSPLWGFTAVMFMLAFAVAGWHASTLISAIHKRRWRKSKIATCLFVPALLTGGLICPFALGVNVPQHYALLGLIFYAYLFGTAMDGGLAWVVRKLVNPRLVPAGSIAGWAVILFLSFHAYRQVSCYDRNPAAPTGMLLINNTTVHDAIRLRYQGRPTTYDYVFSNAKEIRYFYHFQQGRWFRMYRAGFAPVQSINDESLKTETALLNSARQTMGTRGVDPSRVLVLYFDGDLFRRDLTDELGSSDRIGPDKGSNSGGSI